MKPSGWAPGGRLGLVAVFCLIVGVLFACATAQSNPGGRPGPEIEPAVDGAWLNPVSPRTRARLQEAFRAEMAQPGRTDLSVAVMTASGGSWSSDAPGEERRFWWASVGKLVTTVLVLEGVEAGRLDLDREAVAYLPDLTEIADGVTLRHLLAHTSGLPDFGALGLLENKTGAVNRQKLLQEALAADVDFDAGTGWRYSNTGYLLLQAILEAESGVSYAQMVRRRISKPLGLVGFAALDRALPPDVLLPDLGDPRPASEFPPNIGGAANTVASAAEMARFWHAVMAGQVVDHALIKDALSTLNPVFDSEYMMMGEGMMLMLASDGSGYWIGHTGGAQQVDTLLLFSPSRQMILAIAGIGSDVRAMDIANAFIDVLDRCGGRAGLGEC